jgi:cytochrome P450
MTNIPLTAVDITSPQFKANPFPFYAKLRAEAPVFPVMLPRKRRAWLVTRYDDVVSVLKDDRFAKNRHNAMSAEQLKKAPGVPSIFKALDRNLLSLDNPDHARLRVLIYKAFMRHPIEGMRDRIQGLANELLDNVAPQGQMDLIAEFALPLTLTAIGQIVGVPTKDNPKFHRWTKGVISAGSNPNLWVLLPALWGLTQYFKKLIAARRVEPQDDLTTALVKAQENDDRLTDDEILATLFLLLSAGHETTVNLIASGTLALLEQPDRFVQLQHTPTLIEPAIEELLRFVCPAETATERYAREDIAIAGITIPKGELVLAVIGSANRDARYFDNPDRLDFTRENNKHLAFGHGAHYCLGAPLSRLEGQVAISTLVRRMPNLRLRSAPEQLQWRGGLILRGLEALPVSF